MARKNKTFTGPRDADYATPAHMTVDIAEIPDVDHAFDHAHGAHIGAPAEGCADCDRVSAMLTAEASAPPVAPTPKARKVAPKKATTPKTGTSTALVAYIARLANARKRAYAVAVSADAKAPAPAGLDAETAAKVARKVARYARVA